MDSSRSSSRETELHISDDEFLNPPSNSERLYQSGLDRSQTLYVDNCSKNKVNRQGTITKNLVEHELNISNRYLGSLTLRPLSIALLRNEHVNVLNLSSNGMDAEGVLYLSKMLKSNSTIREINLSSNGFGNKGAIAIADILKSNNTIVSLDISDNRLDEDAGKYLALGLEENQSLKKLNLSKNNFSEMGAVYIGRGLSENFTMEELNISWCRLRKKGAVGLCQGIRSNVSLLTIDLSWNGMGYEGALALAEVFKHNKHLREMDISNCRINWQGALFLAKGLRDNFWLESLKLGGNPLSTTGCMDILESITGNDCAISHLDLKGNYVTQEFDVLAMSIALKRDFQWLHDGVLGSHDVYGQRLAKKKDPMAYVIEYMQQNQVRALELFRSFDKDVAMKMQRVEFIDRLQKVGIVLPDHELDELMYQIKKGGDDGPSKAVRINQPGINYKKFSQGVQDQIRKERFLKIKEQKLEKKLENYHNEILRPQTPSMSVAQEMSRLSLEDVFFDKTEKNARLTKSMGHINFQVSLSDMSSTLPPTRRNNTNVNLQKTKKKRSRKSKSKSKKK